MATEAQVNANRSNAQKSTGPRTPEGKAVVAQNAVQHGLLARAAVLQGEDWEEYTCYHEEMFEELYPDGMQEEELAARIVDLSWRLRRARRYQDVVFEALYDKHAAEATEPAAPPDPIPSVPSDPVLGRMLLADFSGARVLERVLLYERRIESSLYRARAELRQLRRQPLRSAKRGSASFDGRWEDSGGYRPVSSLADGDFTRERASAAPARPEEVGRGRPTYEAPPSGVGTNVLGTQGRLCETNPISAGCGVDRVPRDATMKEVERGRPTYEEAPNGVRMNVPDAEGQSCETNPIGGGIGVQRSGFSHLTPDPRPLNPELLCETNPICGGVSGLKCEVSSEQGQSCETNPIGVGTEESQVPCGTEVRADSGEKRAWENKANFPALAGVGAVPAGLEAPHR